MRFFILFGLFFTTFSQANTDNERTLFDLETIDIESVNEFIKAGVNVNAQGTDGFTFLHLAIRTSVDIKLELVETLIKAGADVNIPNEDGLTPLHLATITKGKTIEIIEALIKAGANVNAQDKKELTPLHYFVVTVAKHQEKIKEIVETLIKAGADVNIPNADGLTPLHLATLTTQEKIKEIVEVLIKSGADVNAQDKSKQTPLHLAFKQAGMVIFDEIKHIIETRVDLNNLSKSDVISHFSKDHLIFFPTLEVIETLIKAGADTSTRNQFTHSLASKVEPALLEYTTDVNLQNKMRSLILEAFRNLLAEATHQKRTTIFQSIKNICSRVFQ